MGVSDLDNWLREIENWANVREFVLNTGRKNCLKNRDEQFPDYPGTDGSKWNGA